jgi:hypothetical protein
MPREVYAAIVRELAIDPLVVRAMLSELPTRSILSEPDQPEAEPVEAAAPDPAAPSSPSPTKSMQPEAFARWGQPQPPVRDDGRAAPRPAGQPPQLSGRCAVQGPVPDPRAQKCRTVSRGVNQKP